MEGIVNSQVVNHLERNRLLPDSQYGFRRGRGTADVLTALQNEWVQAVPNGGSAQVIAVDIAGVFDRVSHTGLLYKAERAGIRGTLLTWLQDYLHSRQLKVVVSGQASSAQPITAGVPQGSILGPTSFLIYVSDIDQCLTPERASPPLLIPPRYTACCNQELLLPTMPPYKMPYTAFKSGVSGGG